MYNEDCDESKYESYNLNNYVNTDRNVLLPNANSYGFTFE